jgi:uncharacterized protein YjdB
VEPTLVVSPGTYTLESLGDTVRLQASLRNGNGEAVSASEVSWTALDPEIATVDSDGRVRSLAPGEARVLATSRGKTETARIRVSQAVATLKVDPANPAITVDASVQMRAFAYDKHGSPVTGLQIDWSSSDPAVAPVTADGSVTGKAPGTATVTARVSGKSASTSVTATAAVPVVASITLSPANPTVAVGATLLMQTVVQDAAGRPIGVEQAWTSSNPGIATVSATGLVTGRAPGTTALTISAGGKSLSTVVTVPAPPPSVASIILTPANPTLAIGASLQMLAAVRDDSGANLSGVALTWSTSNATVAAVSAGGTVTGLAAGTATITVSGGGKSTSTLVTVPAPAAVLSSITLTPANPTIAVGATQQMLAVARDAGGAVMTGVALTWSSSNATVASVSAAGLVTARAAGTATVTVAGGGKSASTLVTVPAAAPVVASILLTPANPTVAIDASQQMQAVARDAGGATIAGVTWTWTSSNATVAAVSPAGYVFGKAAGTAVITVAGGGKSATTTVTVPAPPAPPPPPPPATGTPLASHGFEDGTLGAFVYPWTQFPGDVRVVADTTGGGKGKVLRIRYARTTTAQSNDVNRGVFYGFPGGHRPGQTLFVGGDLFIPTPAPGMESQNRKLMYWFPLDEPGVGDPDWLVVRAWGHDLSVEAAVGTVPTVIGTSRGSIAFAAWQRLEAQITLNSSPTASDGVVRVWVNGVLKIEATGLRLITKANPTYAGYKEVGIGYQVNASTLYEESRYWDRLMVSTGRIGP